MRNYKPISFEQFKDWCRKKAYCEYCQPEYHNGCCASYCKDWKELNTDKKVVKK